MTIANQNHNFIVENIIAALNSQPGKRPWECFTNNMRIRTSAAGSHIHSDGAIVCRTPRYEKEKRDILLNPAVIIELISNYCQSCNRVAKFGQYRTLDSLHDYLLISQDKYHAEHYFRNKDNSWRFSEARNLEDVICITSVDCTLALEEIYRKNK